VTVSVTSVTLTFISAVVSSKEQSVLTPVQLMWVNLIQDTLAALALATDPPHRTILDRKPDAKMAPLITSTMWKLITTQSIYQIVITLVLYFAGDRIFSYTTASEKAQLQTAVFNTYVWMQIFNQYKYVYMPRLPSTVLTLGSCRRIDNKLNILDGILQNWFFIATGLVMIGGQITIMMVGGRAFSIVRLSAVQWAYSLVLGVLCIPFGAVLRLIPLETMVSKAWKSSRLNRGRKHEGNGSN
jgi:P-type Ca2+ transporter type 2C